LFFLIFHALSFIRFLFDGQQVREDQTPEQLGMEDDDLIDACLPQLGGGWLLPS
jgi:small ubiquitin-related modifier